MPAYLEYLFFSFVVFIIFPFTIFNYIVLNTHLINGIKPFVVTSGSMEPAISTGSIIYTFRHHTYKIGDIITYSEGKENISHRIIGKKRIGGINYYVTKGDANKTPDDDLIRTDEIYGRVESHIPFIGSAILLIRKLTV